MINAIEHLNKNVFIKKIKNLNNFKHQVYFIN
jgi:hypothetical protein